MSNRFSAYAVFDESGDAGSTGRASRYLIVAGIICDNLEPLRRAVMRVRRRLPDSLRGKAEVKAFETPTAAQPILESLTAMDARIVSAIVDKHRYHLASAVDLVAQAYAT